MKVYRISQENPSINPQATQEVIQAVATLNQSIANINKSLKLLEQNHVADLFKRDTLINALQSGTVATLDINVINESIEAMASIAQTIPVINESMKALDNNNTEAMRLQVDSRSIQSVLIKSLQTGDYSQFQSILQNFQTMLPSMSRTEDITI